MKRYDSYKDSGVKWLGEIPSHWEVNKAKYYFFSKKEIVGKKSANYERLALTLNGVVKRQFGDNLGLNPEKLDTYQIVDRDDLIFKLIDLENFKTSRVGLTPYNGIVSPAYIRIKNKGNVYMRYYEYYYLSLWYRHILNDLGTPGVRSNLSAIDLLNLNIPLPSLSEQEAIANYLDAATSKIDAAIAQQQKMIDLLNERKQIIINSAVTKGLDPNVKMKPSGVDWIGNIPEHWEIVPIKRYNNVCTGKTPNTTKEYYFENGDICWYTPGDLNQFNLNSSERKVTERAKKENACPIFPSNTVYLVGIGGTIGKVSYAERESSCNQQINAIVPQKDYVYYKYLAYSLQTFKIQIYQNANLSTLPIINQERTGALQMLLPPQVEQKAIVEYIEKVIRPIDLAIEGTNKQISLLQERKQIIINDVVTGKVKVV